MSWYLPSFRYCMAMVNFVYNNNDWNRSHHCLKAFIIPLIKPFKTLDKIVFAKQKIIIFNLWWKQRGVFCIIPWDIIFWLGFAICSSHMMKYTQTVIISFPCVVCEKYMQYFFTILLSSNRMLKMKLLTDFEFTLTLKSSSKYLI